MSAFNIQIGGGHYKDLAIQPLEFIVKNKLNWYDGSIVKYACRHKVKGGAEDLKKIIHYAQMELEQEYGVTTKILYTDVPKKKRKKREVKKETPEELSTP